MSIYSFIFLFLNHEQPCQEEAAADARQFFIMSILVIKKSFSL